MISCSNADELLFAALDECFNEGIEVTPRGQETFEVSSWSARLRDPRARLVKNPARDVRKGYCAASVAWNLAKRNDVESICWWNPGGRHISDDGETFHGANYGQRWGRSLDEAIHLLRQDPETRRAWVPIWDRAEDLTGGYSRTGKDTPCTIGFGLRIRTGAPDSLDMQVVMRSQNTMVLPYDVFLFATLQELIANELLLELGDLYWHCNSLHLYGRREYAMNRATYDWYHSNLFAARNRDYSWNKEMTPMPILMKTLTTATDEWPRVMEQSMEGREACEALKDDFDLDAVETLMVEDAIRKHAETKASVA